MPNVLIRSVPEEDLAPLRARAEARGMSLQAYMLEVIHRQVTADRNLLKLREIESRLREQGRSALSMADVLAAKDAPRHGAA